MKIRKTISEFEFITLKQLYGVKAWEAEESNMEVEKGLKVTPHGLMTADGGWQLNNYLKWLEQERMKDSWD